MVACVAPGSLADSAGIRPGDGIVSINGVEPRDAIDVAYLAGDEELELAVERQGELIPVRVRRTYAVPLGLTFERPLFDGIRTCSNRCVFCFVDQLPGDARASLRIKDDDYRLSYLTGSFITLSNLNERDFRRIGEQRISPLYVSVHSTDPLTRGRMLGLDRSSDVMRPLARLCAAGIEVHAQVVVCPGLNDGAELARTVDDLASLWPGVRSVGIVPVGLSGHRQGLESLTPVDAAHARRAVLSSRNWADGFRRRLGSRFVWCADELYLKAGVPLPPAGYYESFPQAENGVGLARAFLDSFDGFPGAELGDAAGCERGGCEGVPGHASVTFVTGELARPLVVRAVEPLMAVSGLNVAVVAVANRYLGGGVGVAGLLAGRDVIEQAREALADVKSAAGAAPGLVVLPAAMFQGEGAALDGVTLPEIGAALGVETVAASDGPSVSRVVGRVMRRCLTGSVCPGTREQEQAQAQVHAQAKVQAVVDDA